jgi:hypothetical protein
MSHAREISTLNKILTFAAVAEAGMGVALLAVPTLVGRLLLGAELTGVGITVARVTGIALIGLGVACWPGTALTGMLTYSALTTLYFAYLGLSGVVGILLWPAFIAHSGLSFLLAREWRNGQRRPENKT